MGIGQRILDEVARFRPGNAVVFDPKGIFDITYYKGKGLKSGATGEITTIAGARGHGVWCDPSKRLIAVNWKSIGTLCVPPKTLKKKRG